MSAPHEVTTATAADEDPIVAAIVRAVEAEEPWQPVAGDDPDVFNAAADPTGHRDRWAGRTVRADRVRAALLMACDPEKPRPKRPVLRIRCANLTGTLDLADVVAEVGVQLIACRVGDISLRDAVLRHVLLERCHVTGRIAGERLRVSGPLRLDRTTVLGPTRLDGARIEDSLLLHHSHAEDEVSLLGATIGGRLSCEGATLHHPGRTALSADQAEISGGVFLTGGFRADGGVRLPGATIGGQLSCKGAALQNPARVLDDGTSIGGRALSADAGEIRGSVFLTGRFRADGEVRLLGATIGGQLNCEGATLHHPGGTALFASGAEVRGDVFLTRGFRADGQVRLRGASIGGDLNCGGRSCTTPATRWPLRGSRSRAGSCGEI